MLELDLDKIKRLAKRRENDNLRFRTYLKGQNGNRIDKIVHKLNAEISAQIDCKTCGNCCKVLRPYVSDSNISFLSEKEGLSKIDFEKRYITIDEFEGEKFLKETPCKYLEGKLCSIYGDRPEDCRSFPHLHKKHFNSRTLVVIGNYEICPIVFNVFERLKAELRFR
ncbi:YkgJ family cysteine cluster protein [Marinilabiliaceae bacterium JC017]|nr:YkgJ family cysteine cluster protein [Marinilabiliaceae bacterium JC017]